MTDPVTNTKQKAMVRDASQASLWHQDLLQSRDNYCEKSSTITPFPQMPGMCNAFITRTTHVISGDAAVHMRIHHH